MGKKPIWTPCSHLIAFIGLVKYLSQWHSECNSKSLCRGMESQDSLSRNLKDTALQHAALKNPTALRRALIRQRDNKSAGDGLLLDQSQLRDGDESARQLLLQTSVSGSGQKEIEVSLSGFLQTMAVFDHFCVREESFRGYAF